MPGQGGGLWDTGILYHIIVISRYIRGIEGDYNNVVGLPAGRLYQEAKEWLGR